MPETIITSSKQAEIKELLTARIDDTYELILSVLGHAGFLEHGTSITHSWLTPYARDFLRDFESTEDGWDFLDKFIEWGGDDFDPNRPKISVTFDSVIGLCCGPRGQIIDLIYKILKEIE